MPGSPRTKLFISYSHKDDAKWLERLQTHLKPLEREGRIERWDDTRIESGNDWHEEIRAALATTKVAVLLISGDFLASEFITENELPPLLEAAEDEGATILPIIVSPCRIPPQISRFQAMNDPKRTLEDMDKAEYERIFVDVANDVERLIAEADAACEEKAPSEEEPEGTIWHVRESSSPFFTGREQLLEELHVHLEQHRRTALYGLGGVGKTQTALVYAEQHRDDYRAVLWVEADSRESLVSGFAALAEPLGLPQKVDADQTGMVAAVQRWLVGNQDWLLVLNNADQPDLVEEFLPQEAHGRVLLTCRPPHLERLGIFEPLEIEELSEADAVAFLKRRTHRSELQDSEGQAAEALAHELGCLPLAMEQAAAYIHKLGCPFDTYLAQYRKQGIQLLEKGHVVAGSYPNSVATTWLLNFEAVERDAPASAELLRASAFLHPDTIPFELITEGASLLGDVIGDTLADIEENPLALDELLVPLADYSLIRRSQGANYYHVHRLVQDVIRDRLTEEERERWTQRITLALARVIPRAIDVDFANWELCGTLLPHGERVARLLGKGSLGFRDAGKLLASLGEYLRQRGRFVEAEPLLRQGVAMRERLAPEGDLELAEGINYLGDLLLERGQYETAQELFERSASLHEASEEQRPRAFARLLNDTAICYSYQGQYTKGKELSLRSLRLREEYLPSGHPEIALSLDNLAGSHSDLGDLDQAETLQRRALEIRERALGPEHPDVSVSLTNLARTIRKRGVHTEAKLLLRRALEIAERSLGHGHPYTAITLGELALTLWSSGEAGEAEPLAIRALKINKQTLGIEHPEVANNLNNLALICRRRGKLHEAEALYRQAISIEDQTLGPNHPDLAITLSNHANTLRKLGLGHEAAKQERRAEAIRRRASGSKPSAPGTQSKKRTKNRRKKRR